MGLFDFLRAGRSEPPPKGDKKLASLVKTATDKRAQEYDRNDALKKLIEVGSADAAEGLLRRFSVKVDPSITDEEEKQMAYDGIVAIGQGRKGAERSEDEDKKLREVVIERTRAYCKTAENLTWSLKVLRALEDDEAYQHELLDLLTAHDTEYMRNVEPKVNLLAALEAVKSEPARLAVTEYLGDVNETVRFHAVQTLFEQGDPQAIAPLVAMLEKEESVRVKNKVCDGLSRLGWKVPDALRPDFLRSTADAYEYRMQSDGSVSRA